MHINFDKIVLDSINENKLFYLCTVLVIIGIISMQIIFPKLYGDFVANIPDSINKLNYSGMLIVLLPYIVSEMLFYINDVINSTVNPKIELSIIKKVSNRVIESAKTSKKEFNSNEFMLNLKKIFDIGSGYHSILAYVVPAIVVSVGIGWNILNADKKMGIVTILILTITFVALIYMSRECTDHVNSTEEKINHFCDDTNDVFSNIEHVLASGTDKNELKRLNNNTNLVYTRCSSRDSCNAQLKFTFSIAYFIIMIIINGITLKLYYDEKLSKSTLVTIFFMVLSLVMLYDSLIHEFQNITHSMGTYQELRTYFNKFDIVDEANLNDDMTISNGNIKFVDIKLKFGDKTVFNGLNLEINGNQKTGIIGEIGSGKSSLLKIISNIVPFEGNVFIDGLNTRDYKHNSIIKNIAYIPQNPKLFNRSILENLKYGTDHDIHKIKKMLAYYNLDQMFNSFENGLYTNVGKNGEKVSGGQRQLIYIIRSLFQNKKILIFDEPTSSLDNEYKLILMNLLNKINNKTIIIVTHDKDILHIFDRVLVFDKGKLIEDIR